MRIVEWRTASQGAAAPTPAGGEMEGEPSCTRAHTEAAQAHAEQEVKGARERFTRAKQGSEYPVHTMQVLTAALKRVPTKVTDKGNATQACQQRTHSNTAQKVRGHLPAAGPETKPGHMLVTRAQSPQARQTSTPTHPRANPKSRGLAAQEAGRQPRGQKEARAGGIREGPPR